ncbi:MAG TPA: hypothetical protein VM056_06265 [Terriglobales bacterium]|nr:hypothetical protein [Terriglobales bacterium]
MRFHPFLNRSINLILAVMLAGTAVYVTHSPSAIRFDRERIDVWVVPGQVHVSGLYHYKNQSSLPKLISLGLPFPVDDQHDQPSTFSISEVTGSRTIEPRITRGDVSFRLWFLPNEEKWVRVDYVQRTHLPAGRYILKTTQEWGRPLSEGLYVLHLGRGLQLVTTNYVLDDEYSFRTRDFYPDKDWVFAWSDPGVQSARARTSR